MRRAAGLRLLPVELRCRLPLPGVLAALAPRPFGVLVPVSSASSSKASVAAYASKTVCTVWSRARLTICCNDILLVHLLGHIGCGEKLEAADGGVETQADGSGICLIDLRVLLDHDCCTARGLNGPVQSRQGPVDLFNGVHFSERFRFQHRASNASINFAGSTATSSSSILCSSILVCCNWLS